jgi:hypothetical protein
LVQRTPVYSLGQSILLTASDGKIFWVLKDWVIISAIKKEKAVAFYGTIKVK